MISERLKAEREALGLSQQALAEHLGVSLRSQQNYEAGARMPDAAYLAGLASINVDVLYVITGQRSQEIPPQQVLPRDQQALLNSYEMCTPTARKHLLQSAALLASGAKPESTKGQSEVGGDNIQVGRGAVVSRSFMGVAIGGRGKKKD
jgi:transcriptional regulator with XRE-family HTH domain